MVKIEWNQSGQEDKIELSRVDSAGISFIHVKYRKYGNVTDF